MIICDEVNNLKHLGFQSTDSIANLLMGHLSSPPVAKFNWTKSRVSEVALQE